MVGLEVTAERGRRRNARGHMIRGKTEAEPSVRSSVEMSMPLWIPISASTLLCHKLSTASLQYSTEILTVGHVGQLNRLPSYDG